MVAVPANTGNFMLQDQRLALYWIQENIHFFGGDKTRVTLSGESAGAIDSCAHIANSHHKGLFSSAVLLSTNCESDVVISQLDT